MIVDKNKTYRTRDGQEVRIYATDVGGDFPVHGVFLRDGAWLGMTWTAAGGCSLMGFSGPFDLIEVRPRHKREVWVNMHHPHNPVDTYHSTRELADQYACAGRIACLHHTFDFEEGEGL